MPTSKRFTKRTSSEFSRNKYGASLLPNEILLSLGCFQPPRARMSQIGTNGPSKNLQDLQAAPGLEGRFQSHLGMGSKFVCEVWDDSKLLHWSFSTQISQVSFVYSADPTRDGSCLHSRDPSMLGATACSKKLIKMPGSARRRFCESQGGPWGPFECVQTKERPWAQRNSSGYMIYGCPVSHLDLDHEMEDYKGSGVLDTPACLVNIGMRSQSP